jgi:hypothetical protein
VPWTTQVGTEAMPAHLHTADVMREENKSKILSSTRIFFAHFSFPKPWNWVSSELLLQAGHMSATLAAVRHVSTSEGKPCMNWCQEKKQKNISDSTVSYWPAAIPRWLPVTWNTLLPPPSCFLPRTNVVASGLVESMYKYQRLADRQVIHMQPRYSMERHHLSFVQRTNLAPNGRVWWRWALKYKSKVLKTDVEYLSKLDVWR